MTTLVREIIRTFCVCNRLDSYEEGRQYVNKILLTGAVSSVRQGGQMSAFNFAGGWANGPHNFGPEVNKK